VLEWFLKPYLASFAKTRRAVRRICPVISIDRVETFSWPKIAPPIIGRDPLAQAVSEIAFPVLGILFWLWGKMPAKLTTPAMKSNSRSRADFELDK
jgi:hypothetical protein